MYVHPLSILYDFNAVLSADRVVVFLQADLWELRGNHCVGGMSRSGKPAAQAKKVAPPAVPDSAFRNSGSSFGSAGYSSAGEDVIFHDSRDGYEMSDGIYSMGPGKSPGTFSYPAFTFPGPQQYTQIGNKSAAYYHQLSLQEDQGIDMTQSPGRDSPGSSGSGSRHSTVSLDSGRASCAMSHHHRPSLSSSSVGSGESSAPARVERMLLQGVPDQEILNTWLTDLHFEEYFPLFVNAGYDMHTISRMTPEDLTAIGIKKPNHRKKLKAEIALLNISDGLPDYIPGSLSEWLRLLRLEEYSGALRSQGYTTVEDTTQITWEDLEDIGIVKLGHQKRMLLAIKRIQDLRAGKTFPPTPFTPTHVDAVDQFLDCDCPRVHSTFKTFHQPWEIEGSHHLYYITDIVPIKNTERKVCELTIRGGRGKSLESLEGGDGDIMVPVGGTSSFTGTGGGSSQWGGARRSFEDGDITPTNEVFPLHQGGGTLPRPRALLKPRPQAKIAPTLCFNTHDGMVQGCASGGTLKRTGPIPPARVSSECSSSSVTVVADLHHPAQYNGSDASFKSSSSTESDSIPFANENAGTIKQRAARNPSEFIPTVRVQAPNDSSSTLLPPRKPGQEPADVLNDIGNMLANLTDELDAMLEEEKRQGLTDD
ncbi:CRK like proto-oncogene, adaptor protein isoform X4 [Rhodnius prolixus]|uniref:CRK like proto-oncogene, adaptor protein isoform X4 n=1 Tax=Rhodnius prolixus TaxID=13249 RepID=UPI003D187A5A